MRLRLHNQTLGFVFTSICFASCGETAKTSEAPAAVLAYNGFLAPADMNVVVPARAYTADTLRAEIVGHADDCVTALVTPMAVKATDKVLTVAQTVDAATCRLGTDAKLQFFYQITCEGGGLRKYDGATFAQFISSQSGQWCPGKGTVLGQLKLAGSNSTTKTTTIIQQGQEDLTACPFTATTTATKYAGTCRRTMIHMQTTRPASGPPVVDNSIKRSTLSGLEVANDKSALWPNIGVASLFYDGWKGTVTYAGANTSPNYQMTSPSGQRLTGTLPADTATAGLMLAH